MLINNQIGNHSAEYLEACYVRWIANLPTHNIGLFLTSHEKRHRDNGALREKVRVAYKYKRNNR